jgi:very-short-patch-repair endonuclease
MSTISIEEVMLKYDQGQSPYQIAKEYETYPNRIRRMLQKEGCVLRGKSEAQKAALESGTSTHPTEGKVRSQEEKLNISAGLGTYWDNVSDEERQKRSDTSKQNWDKLSDQERARITALGVEGIRRAAKEGSKLEKEVKAGLEEAGYSLEAHNKNLIPMEKLEIDLYIRQLNVIIEIDGPSHFLPIWGEDHLQKQEKYDLKKNGTLLSKGFVVIRVRAIKDSSLSRTHKLVKNLVDILESVEESFPEESKRFIEVEL